MFHQYRSKRNTAVVSIHKISTVTVYRFRYCKQEVFLKKIIVEGYRAVGSLNDSFQSSNCLLAPFVVVVLY